MAYIGKQPTKAPLTASDIEDGIITAAKIEDGAVVAAEIASNAVTTAKINADAVTSAKIADNAVVTAAINADAITGAKIADDAINSEHYTDGSIDTAHLADGQVTTAKLATAVFTGATDIGADIVDADLFLMDDGAGGTIRKTTASRIKTYAAGLDGVTTGSGNVTITDGNLIVADGHGIDFSATGDASGSSAELLDDYEEGTWTAGIDSGVFSFSKNTGYYRKVGNLVYVHLYIVTNGYTSGSRVNVTGLPFTSKNISSYDGHYPISCTRFNGVHESVLAVYPMVNPGGTTIKCDTMTSTGTSMSSNNVELFTSNTHIRFGGCYITD